MENTKTQEIKHPARHRALTVLGVILCVVLIPIVLINCTLIVKQFLNKDEVPSVGGVFPMIVLTDSMAGTFDGGSLLFCKTVDTNTIKEGDIICFFDPAGNGTTTTTHRVQEIKIAEDGTRSFVTKGDANGVADKQSVAANKVVGEYWFHIAGLGSVAMFMQTTPGLIIFVIVPILLLVLYDIARRRRYDIRKDSETDALVEELQALRAQKAAQAAGVADAVTGAAGATPAPAGITSVVAGAAPAQTMNSTAEPVQQVQKTQPAQVPQQTVQPARATAQVIGEDLPSVSTQPKMQPAVATAQTTQIAQPVVQATPQQQPVRQATATTVQQQVQPAQQAQTQQVAEKPAPQQKKRAGKHSRQPLKQYGSQGNPWV